MSVGNDYERFGSTHYIKDTCLQFELMIPLGLNIDSLNQGHSFSDLAAQDWVINIGEISSIKHLKHFFLNVFTEISLLHQNLGTLRSHANTQSVNFGERKLQIILFGCVW